MNLSSDSRLVVQKAGRKYQILPKSQEENVEELKNMLRVRWRFIIIRLTKTREEVLMTATKKSKPQGQQKALDRRPQAISHRLSSLERETKSLRRDVGGLRKDVGSLRQKVEKLSKETATKKEIRTLATKKELKALATKEEMARGFAAMNHRFDSLERMIHEQDARNEEQARSNAEYQNWTMAKVDFVIGQFDTFRVEKTALAGAQMRLEEKVDGVQVEVEKLKESSAKDIQDLRIRVDRLEGGATTSAGV